MTKHVYGWKPDLPDFRDHEVQPASLFMAASSLPRSVDLRQDKLFNDLSRLFLYWNERNLEGTVNQDSGAYIRDGIKVAASLGVSLETLWPYDESRYKERPTEAAFSDARHRRITEYARVRQDTPDLKRVLASGFPIIIGLTLYASFESDAVTATGIVPLPDQSESCLGGHAVLIVGYDDAQACYLVRNSWGKDWGDSGYFWLPYAYVTTTGLASDLWVVRH